MEGETEMSFTLSNLIPGKGSIVDSSLPCSQEDSRKTKNMGMIILIIAY